MGFIAGYLPYFPFQFALEGGLVIGVIHFVFLFAVAGLDGNGCGHVPSVFLPDDDLKSIGYPLQLGLHTLQGHRVDGEQ